MDGYGFTMMCISIMQVKPPALKCKYYHSIQKKRQRVAEENKKSPQIVGLRPPMCSQIFQQANFNVYPLNILAHLQLLRLHNLKLSANDRAVYETQCFHFTKEICSCCMKCE